MKTKITLAAILVLALFTSHAQQAVPNGNVESWTLSPNSPDGWTSYEDIIPPIAGSNLSGKDSIDTYQGAASVILTSQYIPLANDTIAGTLSIGTGSFSGGQPKMFGTPFTSSPDTLNFAYKYAPNGSDTAQFQIALHKAGGSTYKLQYGGLLFSTAGQWATISLPLKQFYSDTTGSADTLMLMFASSKQGGGGSPLKAPTGSVLHVDAISFGYYTAPTGPAPKAYTLGHDPITTGPHDFNLYGVIKSASDTAHYSFVYSVDPTFTTSATTTLKSVICDSLVVVYGTANALTGASTYYYYLTATNANGTTNGGVLSFYTDTVSPVFEIYGGDVYPSQFGNFVSLNGKLSGLSGSHTISFEWGTKPNQLDSVYLSDAGVVADLNSHYPRTSIQGLATGVTGYYRMKGVSATDSFFTDIRPFYVGTPYTLIQTLPATSVGTTTGDLNAQVQGFTLPLKLDMEYYTGFPGNFNHSPLVYVADNSTLYNFQLHATNLVAQRLWGYRFRAESWLGNFYGNELLFLTQNKDSVFQTLAATGVTDSAATLHGFAQNIGLQLYDGFEYGTTSALGTYVQADTLADALVHNPAYTITGLQPNTTYYYALRAGYQYSNATYVYGDTLQFTTGSTPVGIGNELSVSSVRIYPNPANSVLHFDMNNSNEFSSVKVFDVEGRELLSKNISATYSLDISALTPGVYFVQTYTKTGVKTGVNKFVKQ